MRTDKEIAFSLRKQGKSYKAICAELGMSKSTLTNWFKGFDFSEAIKKHLSQEVYDVSKIRLEELNKVRGASLRALYERAEEEAMEEMGHHVHNPLFTMAVATYWGEGDKVVNGQVRIINTDPYMIKIFKQFLLEICSVPESKIRGALYIYSDLDEADCKNFWIKNTGITRYHKTMVLPSRHKTRRVENGICSLVVSNTYLKRKILFWIDHLPKMVLNG